MPTNKRKKKILQRQGLDKGPSQEERRRQSVNSTELGGGGPPPGFNSRKGRYDDEYNSSGNSPWIRRAYGIIVLIMLTALIIPLIISSCTPQNVVAADNLPANVAANAKTAPSYSRARYLKRDLAETPPTMSLPTPTATLPETSLYVGETGHYLKDGFLAFWRARGGKAVFGNPISEEFSQNGLTLQYFEKALFEYHPEERGTKNEVQLGFLGKQLAEAKNIKLAPVPEPSGNSGTGRAFFAATGHTLSGQFKQFWDKNNGLGTLGLPISEELTEGSMTIQYFERGRLETRANTVFVSNSGDLLIEAKGWPRPLKLPMDLNIDGTEIYQGRTLSIRLDNGGLWEPEDLKATVGINNLRFFRVGSSFKALYPFSPSLEAKNYPITISFNDLAARQRVISLPMSVVKFNFPLQRLYIPDDKSDTLDPATEDAENKILAPIYETYSALPLWTGVWGLPSPNAVATTITTEFGERRAYNDSPDYNVYHGGIDYAEAEGTPVFAAATGKVIYSGSLKVRGNTVIIDHGMGVLSLYFHLSQIAVKPGTEVKGGTVIGRVGTTGRSSGAHLHWEVRVNGVITDPRQFQRLDYSK